MTHQSTYTQKFLAWLVHGYTALGLLISSMMAVLIIEGGQQNFSTFFLLMVIALIVDATDGTLARMVNVKKHAPSFDGRRLDDLIDFLTYTFLPILFLWRSNILLPQDNWILLFALISSAYGFCQADIKTNDGYFLGFPSYWNIIALYLYALPIPHWAAISVIVFFAVFTFVPSRYLYPSQHGYWNKLGRLLGVLYIAALLFIMLNPATKILNNEEAYPYILSSLFYPIGYVLISWGLSLGWLSSK